MRRRNKKKQKKKKTWPSEQEEHPVTCAGSAEHRRTSPAPVRHKGQISWQVGHENMNDPLVCGRCPSNRCRVNTSCREFPFLLSNHSAKSQQSFFPVAQGPPDCKLSTLDCPSDVARKQRAPKWVPDDQRNQPLGSEQMGPAYQFVGSSRSWGIKVIIIKVRHELTAGRMDANVPGRRPSLEEVGSQTTKATCPKCPKCRRQI